MLWLGALAEQRRHTFFSCDGLALAFLNELCTPEFYLWYLFDNGTLPILRRLRATSYLKLAAYDNIRIQNTSAFSIAYYRIRTPFKLVNICKK